MKKEMTKVVSMVASLSMAAVMCVGCGTSSAEMVSVTFMNGEEELGSIETEVGKVIEADSYADYESMEGNEFAGWFETPTYLEASAVDMSTATFTEDTVLYGLFKSDSVTEDTRKWYIVGTSDTGYLSTSNWAADISDDEKAMFELKGTGNTNEFSVTMDLYEGDQFQLIADWAWDTQYGFGYITDYDESQIENGGGLSGNDKTSNINVLQDGNYTVTLVTNPDDEAQTQLSIVRNGDASGEVVAVSEEKEFEITDDTNVKVKGSWVSDWSELKDLENKGDGIYTITMDLDAMTELYFSVFEGDEDTELGLNGSCAADDASKALLEDAYNVQVTEAGTYTFTVDLNTFTFTVEK